MDAATIKILVIVGIFLVSAILITLAVVTIRQFVLKKKAKIRILIVSLAVTVLLLSASSVASILLLGVPNPISSSIGIIRIFVFNEDYAQIQHQPKVVLFRPGYDMRDFCEAQQGYTFLDQGGGGYVLENNGKIEHASVFRGGSSSYFSVLRWE